MEFHPANKKTAKNIQMNKTFFLLITTIMLFSCNRKNGKFDATGTFESDEVVVSAQIAGQIMELNIEEGDHIPANKIVGVIDSENIQLQKEQVKASIGALGEKTADVTPQVKLLNDQLRVQQSQMNNLVREKERIQNLIKADAATGKQLDDINSQIEVVTRQMDVTRQQIKVQENNISTQNRSILSEKKPLQKKVDQLNDQLEKANIINPLEGTIITKYAEAGEFTSPGKALYKIANLSSLYLRAYISNTQLSNLKLGQQVKVYADKGEDDYREYTGTVTWISDKAEFTPKNIQTKDERANLVYAIKIKVQNDGFLKIGMYGEVKF